MSVSCQLSPPSVLIRKSLVWPQIGGSVGAPIFQLPSRSAWNAPWNVWCVQNVI
jgi:hypothetical protein